MKVALCDKDANCIQQLFDILSKATKEYRNVEIYKYKSGEELISDLRKTGIFYDILFIETELEKLDGFSVAKVVHENNSACLIMFVTANMKYIFKAFEIRAFRYIMKPFEKEKIVKHFLSAFKTLRKDEKKYIVYTKATTYTFHPDDILFLESSKRQVNVHTVNGDISFYSKLCSEEEKLKEFKFLRIHQGFLVNMAYIKTIHSNDVVLTNGMIIPISKSKKKEILKSYTKYITEYDTI